MIPGIVDDVADITPGWLTSVLESAGVEASVRAVTAEPVGTGQLGSCYRLRVDYERGDGPGRLVVKLPATNPSRRAAAGVSYRCETSFYREIAATVKVRVPHCHFAMVSDDASAFTLLLEDLAPAEQGDQIAGCTVAQAREAAANVAGLHGPTWCDPSLRDLDWVIPGGPESTELAAAILGDATKAFVERYRLQHATIEVLQQFSERFVTWANGRPEPFSLVHSDYRLDNLLFAPPGSADPVIAVDWQLVTVGLPLRDVAFLVATGLPTDSRRAVEREIVDEYHRALLGYGVEDYDAERCWEDYRYALFHPPMITVLGAFVAQATERGDRMFTVMAERAATAIVDLDAFSLL